MQKTTGFTLVELSIVLVIIGLIVSGVVGGQSLIASATTNKAVKQVQEFEVAIRAFELQYNYLPGDWPDAREYYPDAVWTPGPSEGERNGNGDGTILGGAEGRMFFKHLSVTGLIKGSYHEGGGQDNPGVDAPAGPFPDSGYSVQSAGWGGIPVEHFRIHRVLDSTDNGGVMNGRVAQSIDKKMDDGEPRSGKVRSRVGTYIPAYTEACRSAYPLDTPDVNNCILTFMYIK